MRKIYRTIKRGFHLKFTKTLLLLTVISHFCFYNGTFALTTHIYIHNLTKFDFDISVKYSNAGNNKKNYYVPGNYTVLKANSCNLILSLDRRCPIGDNIYSIKLKHACDTINLKQKLSRTESQKNSDLMLRINNDSWHQIHQKCFHHVSYQQIANSDIVIDCVVEHNFLSEDVIYSLLETYAPEAKNKSNKNLENQLPTRSLTVRNFDYYKDHINTENQTYNTLNATTVKIFNILVTKFNTIAGHIPLFPVIPNFIGYSPIHYVIFLADSLSEKLHKQDSFKVESAKQESVFFQHTFFEYSKNSPLQGNNYSRTRTIELM